MDVFLGIDTGLKGAVAVKTEKAIDHFLMPVRKLEKTREEVDSFMLYNKLADIIQEHDSVFACVEKIHSMPKQSAQSGFSQGRNYQAVLSVLEVLRIPFVFCTAQQWKQTVLAGLPWKGNKSCSCVYVENKYPQIELVSGRRKKPHDGIADAVCICEYGIHKHG